MSGTATQDGSYDFTISVDDPVLLELTLVIAPAAVTTTTTTTSTTTTQPTSTTQTTGPTSTLATSTTTPIAVSGAGQAPGPTVASQTLPRTGSDLVPLTVLAMTAVALGIAVMESRRRVRNRRRSPIPV